jgi:hypothetical protein
MPVSATSRIVLDTFDENQHFRRNCQNAVSRLLRREFPIGRVSRSPGRRAVRFVFNVNTDNIRHIFIAVGEKSQIVEPLLFAVIICIPKLG